MKIRKGSAAETIMLVIGYCGEMPISMLKMYVGYHDYNRRVVTALLREGYLQERRFQSEDRHVVRSLRLSNAGMEILKENCPVNAEEIEQHLFSPGDGMGNWKRAKRLHRGAACLLLAIRLGALFRPTPEKDEAIGERPVYYSAYEFNKRYEQDNKSARVNGVLISRERRYYPMYYLGSHNLFWNPEVETGFRERFEASELGRGLDYGCTILIADDWMLASNLVSHISNRRSRMIRITDSTQFRMITFDYHGLLLLWLLMDERRKWALGHFLERRINLPFSTTPKYLFDLRQIEDFKPATNSRDQFFRPDHGAFFSFQIPVMQKITVEGVELQSIPAELLKAFYEEYTADG
jgi:hypothetical protein